MEGNESNEVRFVRLLREAGEQGCEPSRAHSIAVTHLETAQLWAERDLADKAREVH